MGKGILIFLLIGVIVIGFFLYFGHQKLVELAFSYLLQDRGDFFLSFARSKLVFPLGLKLEEVEVKGEGFALFLPAVLIRFPFNLFPTFSLGKITLFAQQAFFTSSAQFLSFWEKLSKIDLNSLPAFKLLIADFYWQDEDRPALHFKLGLNSKRGESIVFEAEHELGSLAAFWEENDKIELSWKGGNDWLLVDGEGEWRLDTGLISGGMNWGEGTELTFSILPEEEGFEFSRFKIDSEKRGGVPFSLEGKGHLFWDQNISLSLTGEAFWGEEMIDFSSQLFVLSQALKGMVKAEVPAQDLQLAADFSFFSDASFQLELLPGCQLKGVTFQGVWEGKLDQEGVELRTEQTSWDLGDSLLPTGVEGKGELTGKLSLDAVGRGSGFFQLVGEEMKVGDIILKTPRVEVSLDGAEARIKGESNLEKGNIEFQGQWQEKTFWGEGFFQEVDISSWLPATDTPLTGSVGGKINLEKRPGEEMEISIILQEGSLSFGEIILGNIVQGKGEIRDEALILSNLVVQKKEGYLTGEIQKNQEEIDIHFNFDHYPFIYPVGEEKLALQMEGEGKVLLTEEGFEADFSLFSPIGIWGEIKGEELFLQATWRDNKITVEKLSASLPLGKVFLEGEITPYQDIALQGRIEGWDFSYQGITGDVEQVSFVLGGNWERLVFSLDGNLSNPCFQNLPIAQEVSISLQGEIPPDFWEGSLSPDFISEPMALALLRQGEITIQKLQLENLPFDLPVDNFPRGSLDLSARLMPDNDRWQFRAENIVLFTDDYGSFTGKLAGFYQEGLLAGLDFQLADEEKIILLNGEGSIDLEKETLDLLLRAKAGLAFPLTFQDIGLAGQLKAQVQATGSFKEPTFQGEISLEGGEVFWKEQMVATVEDLQAKLENEQLRIEKAKGKVLGFSYYSFGSLNREEVDLSFSITGNASDLNWGEGISGSWEGDFQLKGKLEELLMTGKLVVYEGLYQSNGEESDYLLLLSDMEASLANLPIALEITLLTGSPFRVKTPFVDLSLLGKVQISASSESLGYQGRLEVDEGKYNLITVVLPLAGYIVLDDSFGLDPQLHLGGSKKFGKYVISWKTIGSLSNYQIIFSSEPLLSKEEIISLLILGDKDAYVSLEELDLEPIGWKVLQFLLGWDYNLTDKIPFIDDFKLEYSPSNQGSDYQLKLEKRLGENMLIGYTQNLSENWDYRWDLEIDFSKEWSLETGLDSDGAIDWKLEYHTNF
ncbi:MAG: translocation and assembly module TamB [Candidatus Atribacteria bacterium]|nr:translocation and assembly module TamB [Candidatus Atribacteria bacterium]